MPKWIWVRDTATGHQFDVEESALRPGLEPMNSPNYPDLEGPGARPRPAKPFVAKDGKTPRPGTPATKSAANDTSPAAPPADRTAKKE